MRWQGSFANPVGTWLTLCPPHNSGTRQTAQEVLRTDTAAAPPKLCAALIWISAQLGLQQQCRDIHARSHSPTACVGETAVEPHVGCAVTHALIMTADRTRQSACAGGIEIEGLAETSSATRWWMMETRGLATQAALVRRQVIRLCDHIMSLSVPRMVALGRRCMLCLTSQTSSTGRDHEGGLRYLITTARSLRQIVGKIESLYSWRCRRKESRYHDNATPLGTEHNWAALLEEEICQTSINHRLGQKHRVFCCENGSCTQVTEHTQQRSERYCH